MPATLDAPPDQYRLSDEQRDAVEQNLGLAHFVVRMPAMRTIVAMLGEETAVSDAYLALMRAAKLYRPERGVRFSTYATVSIIKWLKRAARLWHRHRQHVGR